jgi:hypothetical protein
MACRITELVLDCHDPDRLASFWCDALGWVVMERADYGVAVGPPGVEFGGLQPIIVLSRTDEPKTQKLRLHVDVSATDRDQDAELQRLLALGAVAADVGQSGDETWHVLADPEGNEFCLLQGRVGPA